MKFSKLSQLLLVSSIGLLVATLFSACAITTIDYVFVASSSGVETFDADASSGALRPGGPTVSTGISSPVALAVTPNYQSLYVANAGNKTIVHFAIGMTAGLTLKDTVTLSAAPVAVAVNAAGTYLYVASGSASLTSYPLASDGAIAPAPPCNWRSPAMRAIRWFPPASPCWPTMPQSTSRCTIGRPTTLAERRPASPTRLVFGFAVGSGGTLTPTTNSPTRPASNPAPWPPTPPTAYLCDRLCPNQMIGYTILGGSTLNFMPSGPFKTGDQPSSIAIDPRGCSSMSRTN